MARYLDPTGTKFWEIERDGATIVRRAGKLGTKGRTQTRTFENPLLARWHYGNFVGYKTHTERYTFDGVAAPAEPVRDDDEWLVHADVLQASGDPLGELIALRNALEQANGELARTKLRAAIVEHELRHPAAVYGDAAAAIDLFELAWRRGRIQRARLAADRANQARWYTALAKLLPQVPACYQQGTILKALFDCPLARAVEELAIGSVGTFDYQYTMLSIVEHAPPTLQVLAIGDHDRREIALAPMRFPALVSFSCTWTLGQAALFDVTTAQCPQLRRLAIRVADSELACRMLLDTKLLDQLTSLVITNWRPTGLESQLRTRAPFVELRAS